MCLRGMIGCFPNGCKLENGAWAVEAASCSTVGESPGRATALCPMVLQRGAVRKLGGPTNQYSA